MYFLFSLFSFIFGTLIGSFLNVVIIRHGTGMGLGGRSRCMTSGNILKWYELIPIVSFVIQRGRSRYTNAKISLQYPIVEAVTGILFVCVLQKIYPLLSQGEYMSSVLLGIFLIIVSIYIVLISVYDAKHMMIPNEFLHPLLIISFVSIFISLGETLVFTLPNLSAFLAGPLVALPLFLFWFFSKGTWMGFADIKIALIMGWLLGLSQGFSALILSFWIGALFAVGLLVLRKTKSEKHIHIPFGPFLLTALIVTFLYNIDIVTIISFFYV